MVNVLALCDDAILVSIHILELIQLFAISNIQQLKCKVQIPFVQSRISLEIVQLHTFQIVITNSNSVNLLLGGHQRLVLEA